MMPPLCSYLSCSLKALDICGRFSSDVPESDSPERSKHVWSEVPRASDNQGVPGNSQGPCTFSVLSSSGAWSGTGETFHSAGNWNFLCKVCVLGHIKTGKVRKLIRGKE